MKSGSRLLAATRTIVAMGTFVAIDAPPGFDDEVERAFGWFREIEARCSRFDANSELSQLARHAVSQRRGEPIPVSQILFEAVRFACAVAEETHGAFDPTVGAAMEARGFDRHYRTGERVSRGSPSPDSIATPHPTYAVSYRDIELDAARQTITLLRPLILDLGAVAKGLAIDMAACELGSCPWFAIDAGGDLFVGGAHRRCEPTRIGIRHPRNPERLIASVRVANGAVCTSGDYERATDAGHHILDPREPAAGSRQRAGHRRARPASCSTTVIAANAMLADALATAAFVLGGDDGICLLERHGVEGLIVSADGERYATAGFDRTHTFLQDAQGTADDHPGAAPRDCDPGRRDQDRCAGSR